MHWAPGLNQRLLLFQVAMKSFPLPNELKMYKICQCEMILKRGVNVGVTSCLGALLWGLLELSLMKKCVLICWVLISWLPNSNQRQLLFQTVMTHHKMSGRKRTMTALDTIYWTSLSLYLKQW